MMEENSGSLSGRRPMSRSQIERRTMTREEIAEWKSNADLKTVPYRHYWETEEQEEIVCVGDEYLVFVGYNEGMTAKVWNVIDRSVPHNIFILRKSNEFRYDLGTKEGVLLRFQFKGEMRIFNKDALIKIIEGGSLDVFQKNDDIIIRIDD